MKSNITKILFALCVAVALSGFVTSPIALVMGFLFTLFFGNPFEKLTRLGISYLLKISVIGLGFGMFLMETLKTGADGLVLTVMTIAATLILGWILTKVLKVDLKLGYLVSAGTSICGGSAIAAVAPVIEAKPEKISMALGVVFLLNSIALFIFPAIGHYFEMSQYQFGMWAAVAIHDTSSVVGAALSFGEEALNVATTVKLARTLWIIPVSIISMFIFKSKDGKVKMPWFILLFILAILINSYFDLPIELTTGITTIAKRFLILTLFLVGSTLSIADLKKTGAKPFILGVLLWVFISISSLIYIMN